MKIVQLIPGSKGADTVLQLNEAMCQALVREGVRFVVRYLGISSDEAKCITENGLALSVVTYAQHFDGTQAVTQLQSAGIPVGACVWLDVEDEDGKTPLRNDVPGLIGKANTWAHIVKNAGYIPGIYVGAGCPLTSTELYALAVQRYWHSCSRVVDRDGHEAAPSCGWTMWQCSPPNMTIGGVKVDVDFAQLDYLSRGVTVAVD